MKLVCGFDSLVSNERIYLSDFGKYVYLEDNSKVSYSVLENLILYFENEEKDFRFFKRDFGFITECIVSNEFYEAFIIGYGKDKSESLKDCLERIDDLRKRFLGFIER